MLLTRATIRVVAAMSLGMACTLACAAPMGFVVNSDSPDDATADSLHRIDLATGATTLIGRVGSNFSDIEGLALNADGALVGIDDNSKSLILLDTNVGAATPFGGLRGNLAPAIPLGTGNADPGITFTCSGQLLAATAVGSVGSTPTSNLFELDLETGRPTPIASGLPVLTDLAASGEIVYGLGFDKLYRVDVAAGTVKGIGSFGANLFSNGGGMAFDADGQLWAIADHAPSSGGNASRIYRIDVRTGAATAAGTSSLVGIESLAIAPTQCSAPNGGAPVVQIPAAGAASLGLLGGLLALVGALTLLRRRA